MCLHRFPFFFQFRQQLRMNNSILLQQNEEQFAIEEQVQQVQVSREKKNTEIFFQLKYFREH